MTSLHDQHCSHQDGQPLNADTVVRHLSELEQVWTLNDKQNQIRFDFMFKDFYETISFVNALAWVANQQDHHPELEVGYKHCLVLLGTHSVGGLSINDFICAAKIEKLLP